MKVSFLKKASQLDVQRKKNPKILIANTPMDYDKIKIYGSRVNVDSVEKFAEIEQAEKEKNEKQS